MRCKVPRVGRPILLETGVDNLSIHDGEFTFRDNEGKP